MSSDTPPVACGKHWSPHAKKHSQLVTVPRDKEESCMPNEVGETGALYYRNIPTNSLVEIV